MSLKISILCLLTLAFSVSAQTSALDEATRLYQAQKFEEAAKAFATITKSDPTNPRVFFLLGSSLYAMSRYEDAVAAFQKAISIGHNPQPMFELAKAYAQLNQRERD